MAVTPSSADRVDALGRPDKWYLSAGDGWIWAPPFPNWLDRPGFWDEAHFLQHELAPLFSVALLDPGGREIPLRLEERRWWPGRLVARWTTPSGGVRVEERFVLPGGRFCSSWRRSGPDSDGGAHLVAFTAQPGLRVEGMEADDTGLRWARTLEDRHGARLPAVCRLGVADGGDGRPPQGVRRAAVRSRGSAARPEWRLTPFPERWEPGGGGLREEVRLEGMDATGLVHAAVQVPLAGWDDELVFVLRFGPTDPELRPDEEPTGAGEALAGRLRGDAADAAGTESSGVESAGARTAAVPGSPPASAPILPQRGSPAAVSRRRWEAAFGRYPGFRCSDGRLERWFDYRIYGLELNGVAGGAGHVRHPAVAEGIGYFHVPIAYSAPCHARETRWSADPSRARGEILDFLENRGEDGSLHGRIYPDHLEGTDFYHADWGGAVLAVEAVHPDPEFRERAYCGLAAYAGWLDRERDPEGSGLYDVRSHYETGQEYTPRYQAVDPDADRRGWEGDFRLKGVDATTYAYRLKRALSRLAAQTGRPGEADRWAREADAVGTAISERMWDPETGIYSDVDPSDGTRTGVKAAVCFYPMLTDLVAPDRLARLLEHLRDPDAFATPYPVPSTSREDPLFSAEGEWKGKRHLCPWNGRVWPMTNSHVIEGLLRQWHRGRRETGPLAADLLRRFVHMMHRDGDPDRPNCYEHYNPLTGHASEYRGIDDYQHSWVLDLLVRGAAGLEPGFEPEVQPGVEPGAKRPDLLRIDPLPMELDRVELSGCVVRGHDLRLVRRGREVRVEVDGQEHRTEVGRPLEIEL